MAIRCLFANSLTWFMGHIRDFLTWLVTSLYVPFICAQEGDTYLFSSSVLFVQANANMSLLASFATEAILNCDHPNSHSASSPAAMALQYTTERRLGWILKRLQLTHCWVSILKYILLKKLAVRLNSSHLSTSELTFPIRTDGKNGVYF